MRFWPRRNPKPPAVDYIAAIQEAGQLRDRIHKLAQEARAAVAHGHHDLLPGIEARMVADLARMQEIERHVSGRVA